MIKMILGISGIVHILVAMILFAVANDKMDKKWLKIIGWLALISGIIFLVGSFFMSHIITGLIGKVIGGVTHEVIQEPVKMLGEL